jgi:hypothetical protein
MKRLIPENPNPKVWVPLGLAVCVLSWLVSPWYLAAIVTLGMAKGFFGKGGLLRRGRYRNL